MNHKIYRHNFLSPIWDARAQYLKDIVKRNTIKQMEQ